MAGNKYVNTMVLTHTKIVCQRLLANPPTFMLPLLGVNSLLGSDCPTIISRYPLYPDVAIRLVLTNGM